MHPDVMPGHPPAATLPTGPARPTGKNAGQGDAPAAGPEGRSEIVHATTVARNGRALLIRGPAGTGKSALAVQMIALGATLVADDRTCLTTGPGASVLAAPPAALAGLIEVRGLGLLRVDHVAPVPLAAIYDLGEVETERLPPHRTTALLGRKLPLFRRFDGAHVAHALLVALAGTRIDPDAP